MTTAKIFYKKYTKSQDKGQNCKKSELLKVDKWHKMVKNFQNYARVVSFEWKNTLREKDISLFPPISA